METIETLVTLYRDYIRGSDSCCFISGGVQQFLNKRKPDHQHRPLSSKDWWQGNPRLSFEALPLKDICRAAEVSREWHEVTSDSLLWLKKLERDMRTWNLVTHLTNPYLYRKVESELSYKDIYLQCSPEVQKLKRKKGLFFNNISGFIRQLLPQKTPKIAIFGPGLESSTSSIIRKILFEPNDHFLKVGLVPGQFEGVGACFTLCMNKKSTFHLAVLYSATKKEREQSGFNRMRQNRLVQQSQEQAFELTHQMQDLCRTLDAFVFVIDVTDINSIKSGKIELFSVINERWSATYTPVLVLCCIKDSTCQAACPCIDVVRALELSSLTKPWQVRHCIVDTLNGVSEGLEWVVEQFQRR